MTHEPESTGCPTSPPVRFEPGRQLELGPERSGLLVHAEPRPIGRELDHLAVQIAEVDAVEPPPEEWGLRAVDRGLEET